MCFLILALLIKLFLMWLVFFFFKQKTAYEMRISDWSSDVCSSDLGDVGELGQAAPQPLVVSLRSLVSASSAFGRLPPSSPSKASAIAPYLSRDRKSVV